MGVSVLLFGSALAPQRLGGALGEGALVQVCGDRDALHRALTSAEVLEGEHLLVLAPATAAELEDLLALAEYLHNDRIVCFAGREVYRDRRLLSLAPRYLGVCDEHPECIREVIDKVSCRLVGKGRVPAVRAQRRRTAGFTLDTQEV